MKLALHSILCLLLLTILSQAVFSQKRPYLEVYNECGVDLQTPIALRKSPPLELNYDLLNTLPDTIIIPVVVHIVHNNRQENLTNAEVVAMLQQCNRQINMDIEDFDKTPEVFKKLAARTRIQLRLAKKDPNGNCTDGIVRLDTSLTDIYAQSCSSSGFPIEDGLVRISHWPPEKYLNIYVGRSLRVGNSGPIGIATFPYDYSESGGCKSIDGIYLNHLVGSYSKNTFGTTLSHELGHWLGLYHIWGRSAGISSTSCSDRDFIDDTPNQAGPSNACFDDFPFTTCNNGPNGNMFTNFMDYGNCLTQFT